MQEELEFSDLVLVVGAAIVLIMAYYFDKWAFTSLPFTSAILLISTVHLILMGGLVTLLNATAELPLDPKSATEGYGSVPLGPTTNETTRFLCASAVTAGWTFRKRVLTHLRNKPQAIAPEVGLDVELVAHVCNFMEKREFRFQVWFAILGVLGIFSILGYWVLPSSLSLFFPLLTLFLIAAALWYYKKYREFKYQGLFTILVISNVLAFFLLPGTLGLFFPFLIPFLVAAALWYYKKYEERFILANYFTRERFGLLEFSRKFGSALDPETIHGIPKDDQNLLVYGGFSPFVGAGIDLGGWSFAIDASKPKGHADEITPFDISELYGVLEDGCKTLLLPGLIVKDFLFVHGSAIRYDKSILPDPFVRPVQSLAPDIVHHYIINSDFRIRHYKWFTIHDWGNELVFSLFLRFSMRGSNLFVDVSRFLLTPLADEYHQIDTLASNKRQEVAKLLLTCLVAGPLASLGALIILLVHAQDWLSKNLGLGEQSIRRTIENDPLYNYGAFSSLRQAMSSARYLNYFQKLDQEMYVKVLDRQILDTIVAFLDDHHVDTSELKAQQTTILNSGILVQRGNVQAQSVAVGAGSQAMTTAQPTESSEQR
jgi:hypothetical protein